MDGDAPEGAADRPGDTEILAHEREVKGEAESVALVGPRLSLDVLKAQYADNVGFLPKVESLGRRFGAMRRTRPDGSCFYRAYIFGIFEQLLGQKERHAAFSARAKAALDYCVEVGYEKVAIEEFYEEFASCLERLAVEGASVATLEAILEENDGYLVCWARCLTSAYLKHHAEEYGAFLTSHSSIQQFCAQEVDPMATEADHLQIVALSSYFGVPVCVVYLDRSEGEVAAEHLFQEGSGPFPPVHLLYRPGHYDVIYPL
mmetsp:Transcript_43927/g.99243  ORF Transcript_43927/g.99243 Transcript_43927/m.99243 type:complete len:260 (-) Transcript_43927:41-820(-)